MIRNLEKQDELTLNKVADDYQKQQLLFKSIDEAYSIKHEKLQNHIDEVSQRLKVIEDEEAMYGEEEDDYVSDLESQRSLTFDAKFDKPAETVVNSPTEIKEESKLIK